MKPTHIDGFDAPFDVERGDEIEFWYDDEERYRWGTVRASGAHRVHVQSGETGTYISPSDIRRVRKRPENSLPLLGERLRLGGGIGMRR